MMNRRDFLSRTAPLALAATPLAAALSNADVRLGIDLFSIRDGQWTPFEYLDYCAKHGAEVVHFSEVRFIGGLEPDHLRKVRAHAERLNIQLEIGMKSICPSSKMFNPKEGTAEEQVTRMIQAAKIVGSPIVRSVLGSMDDRSPVPITKHIEDMVVVLRNVRSR
ncbi:MAG TPA: hypothetical protein VN610_07210, partial [Bryobacteraceae bacterium]|nr:hypothetical protein [Bryobacteraceae bacterium]